MAPGSQYGTLLVGVDVNGSPVSSRRSMIRTASGYQRYSLTFDAPAGATARVWFYTPKTQPIPYFGNQPTTFMMLDGIRLERRR